jgi:hypothetical protein
MARVDHHGCTTANRNYTNNAVAIGLTAISNTSGGRFLNFNNFFALLFPLFSFSTNYPLFARPLILSVFCLYGRLSSSFSPWFMYIRLS